MKTKKASIEITLVRRNINLRTVGAKKKQLVIALTERLSDHDFKTIVKMMSKLSITFSLNYV
jgi:hypothetical protein